MNEAFLTQEQITKLLTELSLIFKTDNLQKFIREHGGGTSYEFEGNEYQVKVGKNAFFIFKSGIEFCLMCDFNYKFYGAIEEEDYSLFL